jgi:CheY-like chemotaxis protein
MVHGLAAQLGGALRIRSKPGLGTNVELWLPVTDTVARSGVPLVRSSDEPDMTANRRTALLVDDEDLVRATAADTLAELGYLVVKARSAVEALDRVTEGLVPDVVMTDHLMPGLTGTELARALQTQRPGLPILIVSGYADVEGIAPDLPRLTKPFTRSELTRSLRRLKTVI